MKSLVFCLFCGLALILPRDLGAQNKGILNLGVSAGGSGLGGVSIQLRPTNKLVFDYGLYVRMAHVDVFEPRWIIGPSMDASFSFFIREVINNNGQKIKLDGFYLKGAKGLGELGEVMAGLGWVHEVHSKKHPKQFWQFQLGPSILQRTETYINTRYPPGYQEQSETWISGMIYTRLSWFFVVTK